MFKKDGYWSYYRHNESLKFYRSFEEDSSYVDGFAYVKIKCKYGYIDTGGKDVKSVPKAVREHFEKWGNEKLTSVADMPMFCAVGFTMFNNGNSYGIKDANSGEIVLDAEYESIYKPQNKLVIVRKNGNYGFYNYVQKTFVLDCIYKYIALIN